MKAGGEPGTFYHVSDVTGAVARARVGEQNCERRYAHACRRFAEIANRSDSPRRLSQ